MSEGTGQFMSVRDMAHEMGLSVARTYQLVADGELPATKIGGVLRLPRAAWVRWLDQQAEDALSHCAGAESRRTL